MPKSFNCRAILLLMPVILLFALTCCPDCPRCNTPEIPPDAKLSPPIIVPPLYKCATAVTVQGFVPGAAIKIYANGATEIGGGVSDATWGTTFGVNPELAAGDKITATQSYAGLTSNPSAPIEVVDYFATHPEGLPKPEPKKPMYNCGGALGVGNLVPGGRLVVFADNNEVGSTGGCTSWDWLFINPTFTTGQKVYALEILCNITGPKSDAVVVQPEPASLPILEVGDVYEGGKYVNVYNITNGALVSVMNGVQQVAGHNCSGGGQAFWLNPQPLAGDVLTATQKLCDVTSDPSDGTEVLPCDKLPPPQVHAVCIEDTYITVSGNAPDALILVYGNGNLIAVGGGPYLVPTVPLTAGMSITATQSLCACVSPLSAAVSVEVFAAPAYEPELWNDPDWILCNNCYNYACNIRTDNFAQPGYAHGAPTSYNTFDCNEVGNRAETDGLTKAQKTCKGCTSHRVALVISNINFPYDYDYHWYRLDDDGHWSHKPGGTAATNLDASDNIITDPAIADRDYSGGPDYGINYSVFCGYYCVDKDEAVIKGWRECRRQ